MADEKCILNPERDCLGLQKATELEHNFERTYETIEKIDDKLQKHDRRITILETLVENLKELPKAINNLEKTMGLMQRNLEILNENVEKTITQVNEYDKQNQNQDARILALDNKSKIDILEIIKQNWWKICMGFAGILYVIDRFIPK